MSEQSAQAFAARRLFQFTPIQGLATTTAQTILPPWFENTGPLSPCVSFAAAPLRCNALADMVSGRANGAINEV